MCGLSGVFDLVGWQGGPSPEQVAAAMSERMRHRGPDSAGLWVGERADVALGHRRLAIIDVSPAGHQPMTSRDGRWTIAYNGELYNTGQMRNRLTHASIPWRGHADTEVLLESIAAIGVRAAVEAANGMFALAAYDRELDELWLARDRFGEKPLYYSAAGNRFVVASELSALRASATVPTEVDRRSLVAMLERLAVPAPHTILAGVSKLPPGSLARVGRDGDIEISAYYDPSSVALAARPIERTDLETRDELDALLRSTVEARMVADVPLGAFLSGGVDSSLIVAMMQQAGSRTVRTFTIGFEADELNEAPAARIIAERLGTDHHEWIVTGADALAVVPELGALYDEPFADSSQIPTTLVSRFASTDLTVALSGDGGDELFGGYERYRLLERLDRYRRGPAPVRRTLGRLLRHLDADTLDAIGRGPLRRALPGPLRNRTGRRLHTAGSMLTTDSRLELYELLLPPHRKGLDLVADGCRRPRPAAHDRVGGLAATELAMALDTIDYLPNDILVKVDRAAMSASLETRAPMLDPELHRFAWSLTPSQRERDGQGKWLLREIVKEYVPEIAGLPKRGFGVPLGAWLRGPLREWAGDLLAPSAIRAGGILDADEVERLWRTHRSGDLDTSAELWSLLMFRSWQEACDRART